MITCYDLQTVLHRDKLFSDQQLLQLKTEIVATFLVAPSVYQTSSWDNTNTKYKVIEIRENGLDAYLVKHTKFPKIDKIKFSIIYRDDLAIKQLFAKRVLQINHPLTLIPREGGGKYARRKSE